MKKQSFTPEMEIYHDRRGNYSNKKKDNSQISMINIGGGNIYSNKEGYIDTNGNFIPFKEGDNNSHNIKSIYRKKNIKQIQKIIQR